MADNAMNIDPADAVESEGVTEQNALEKQKTINEEYKIWKKHACYLYDVVLSRALDWPTLTVQWFPDVLRHEDESEVHRLLLGTHTDQNASDGADRKNYLQIGNVVYPKLIPDPDDYDDERGEIGGYGGGNSKKSRPEMKFDIVQKIDHPGEVNRARYMPQNPDLLATMTPDGRALIFDRTKHPSKPTGRVNPDIELSGHKQEGFALNWNPNVEGQLATGSADTTVKVWDIKDYAKSNKSLKAQKTYNWHSAAVNAVEFHHLFPWMLTTVSDDKSIHVIDLRESTDTKPARLVEQAHSDEINCVSFYPATEVILATGSADKSIGIWDLRNMEQKLHACENHKDSVIGLEWHPQQKPIIGSASLDRRIIFWDLARCGEEQTPEDEEDGPPELLFIHGGHTDRVADFSFNKNDPWLMCSAAEDNILQVWKTAKTIVGRSTTNIPFQQLEK